MVPYICTRNGVITVVFMVEWMAHCCVSLCKVKVEGEVGAYATRQVVVQIWLANHTRSSYPADRSALGRSET